MLLVQPATQKRSGTKATRVSSSACFIAILEPETSAPPASRLYTQSPFSVHLTLALVGPLDQAWRVSATLPEAPTYFGADFRGSPDRHAYFAAAVAASFQ